VGFFVLAAVLLLGACGPRAERSTGSAPIVLTDDSGTPVQLAGPATRVISLIPSVTETLLALQVPERIVGRTEYDRDPAIAAVPQVGSGLEPSIEAIVALRPDLVVVWANDKRGDVRSQLGAAGIPTVALSLQDTADVFRALTVMGTALGVEATADSVLEALRASLMSTQRASAQQPRRRVFYVVYNDPPMTAGPGTFIDQVIDVAGGENVFHDAPMRWPTVSLEEVVARDPDIVILPVGEMPVSTLSRLRNLPGWRDLRAVKGGCVALVDADLANRPGPRVGEAARHLADTLRMTCPLP
jgi:iron complex transport system substrate-binding protein